MKKYHYRSPAKINLTLEIIDKLPNGYHALRTVMMKLENLYDTVDILCTEVHSDILITCSDSSVPTNEKNICHKIAQKFFERLGKSIGLEINLQKNIPAAAGLGGGSSNGACVLMCLNDHFDQYFGFDELIDIAASVGKDIPFFFSQQNGALIEGMGEIISEEFLVPQKYFLIINPQIDVSTPWAFGELAKHLWFMTDQDRENISYNMRDVLKRNEDGTSLLYNDFEIAVFAHYPIIAEIKQALIAFGAQNALMSGSGSTVFGVFETEMEMHKAQEKLIKRFPDFYIAKG